MYRASCGPLNQNCQKIYAQVSRARIDKLFQDLKS